MRRFSWLMAFSKGAKEGGLSLGLVYAGLEVLKRESGVDLSGQEQAIVSLCVALGQGAIRTFRNWKKNRRG